MTGLKYLKLLSFLLIIAFVVSSCKDNKNRSALSRSIGNTSEIVIVLQDKQQWDNVIGETLRKVLEADQYGLPQKESLFKLAHITSDGFSELFQKHHSIIIVNIDKNAKKVRIEKSRDKWAKPQIIYRITAPSNKDFVKAFESYAPKIIKSLNQVERARIMNFFNAGPNIELMQKFADKFKLKMTIPQGFYLAKTEPGFMWLKLDANKHNLGIIAISTPYKDTLQFSNESITSRIMLFMHDYIPGPTEGSWMSIDTVYVPPVSKHVDDFFVPYTIETRGMWRVENDFMAGPFVAYTFINPKTDELMTLLGYVYKPNKDKRDLLRQLEAILYSTKAYNGEKIKKE
jgi:hypothetical protein